MDMTGLAPEILKGKTHLQRPSPRHSSTALHCARHDVKGLGQAGSQQLSFEALLENDVILEFWERINDSGLTVRDTWFL